MLQPKDTDWLNGYKNKTHTYAVYKKSTSDFQDTYRLKVRGWKNIFHANEKRKKAGIAILISDKIDLKIKTTSLHNDQGINPRGKHNNCKYLCTHKTNTNTHKRRN